MPFRKLTHTSREKPNLTWEFLPFNTWKLGNGDGGSYRESLKQWSSLGFPHKALKAKNGALCSPWKVEQSLITSNQPEFRFTQNLRGSWPFPQKEGPQPWRMSESPRDTSNMILMPGPPHQRLGEGLDIAVDFLSSLVIPKCSQGAKPNPLLWSWILSPWTH